MVDAVPPTAPRHLRAGICALPIERAETILLMTASDAAGDRYPRQETRMNGDSEQRTSERLALIQESLRGLLARTSDQVLLDGIAAAAHELGLIRLGLDVPSPRSRRAHIRVKEAIGTALQVGEREIDAAIIDISVGGVGLLTDERLPSGTVLRVAVPPIGWIEAEVVGAAEDRLHLRFRADPADAEQQRALLDLVLRHYD